MVKPRRKAVQNVSSVNAPLARRRRVLTALVGCSHASGLLTRPHGRLALMGARRLRTSSASRVRGTRNLLQAAPARRRRRPRHHAASSRKRRDFALEHDDVTKSFAGQYDLRAGAHCQADMAGTTCIEERP